MGIRKKCLNMAKWGEGDPRWIVEERPDATNVNNWHWTEKNADAWSKSKIKELFTDLVIEDAKIGNVVVEEVEKVEGEARVNNRKGKLIFFYEWELALKWKGHVNGNDKEVKGKVEIPNFSEEHTDLKDVDIEVQLTTKGPESDVLKEMMRKGVGAATIRSNLEEYLKSLKTEYATGVILPKKGQENGQAPPVAKSSVSSSSRINLNTTTASLGKVDIGSGTKIEVNDIKMEERMKCTGQELYNALTQRDMIQIFTNSEAKMSDVAAEGVQFELLGGGISGKYLEVVPFTKIVQEWRLKSWPSGHFSKVELTISQTKEDTKLVLNQTGVPVKEVESTRAGWQRYYFEAMKRTFGFGSMLF